MRLKGNRTDNSQNSAGVFENGENTDCMYDFEPAASAGSDFLKSSNVMEAVNSGHLVICALSCDGLGREKRRTFHQTHPTSSTSPPAPYRAYYAPSSLAPASRHHRPHRYCSHLLEDHWNLKVCGKKKRKRRQRVQSSGTRHEGVGPFLVCGLLRFYLRMVVRELRFGG